MPILESLPQSLLGLTFGEANVAQIHATGVPPSSGRETNSPSQRNPHKYVKMKKTDMNLWRGI